MVTYTTSHTSWKYRLFVLVCRKLEIEGNVLDGTAEFSTSYTNEEILTMLAIGGAILLFLCCCGVVCKTCFCPKRNPPTVIMYQRKLFKCPHYVHINWRIYCINITWNFYYKMLWNVVDNSLEMPPTQPHQGRSPIHFPGVHNIVLPTVRNNSSNGNLILWP